MLCTKCGNKNASGAVCKKCGAPLLSRLADDTPEEKKKKVNATGVVNIVDASQFQSKDKDKKDDKNVDKNEKDKKGEINIPLLDNKEDKTDIEVLEEEKEEEKPEKEENKEFEKQEEVKEVKKDDSNAIPVAERKDNLPIEETNPSLETVVPDSVQEVKTLDPLTNNNDSNISLSTLVANNADINNFSVPADFRFTDEVELPQEETPTDKVEEIRQAALTPKAPRPPRKKNTKRIRKKIQKYILKFIAFLCLVYLVYYLMSKFLFPHGFIIRF